MSRLQNVALPAIAVGLTAFVARLPQTTEQSMSALYIVPLGIAVMSGLWRPSLLGSIGAWLGWSGGVALGSFVDTGELWLYGPAVYALLVAFVPHAIGSIIRTLLRARPQPAT